jgi:hypothetical protein
MQKPSEIPEAIEPLPRDDTLKGEGQESGETDERLNRLKSVAQQGLEWISKAKGAKQEELSPDLVERETGELVSATKDEGNLEKAKQLMNEAQESVHASSNKKDMKKRFVAVLHALDLPPDSFENFAPSELLKELNEIIEQKSKVIDSEVVSNEKNDVDLVTEASGGRALCGIYHSEYESPRPAGQPILLAPTDVNMFGAGERSQKRFVVYFYGYSYYLK